MQLGCNYYSINKYTHKGGVGRYVNSKDGTLFANGIYPCNLKTTDMPVWYIKGRFIRGIGYLNAKDVKDLIYVPNMMDPESFRYDFLYISYKGKMTPVKYPNAILTNYGEDFSIHGFEILEFVRGVKKYAKLDLTDVIAKIHTKLLWLKSCFPKVYDEQIGNDFDLDRFLNEGF